MLKMNLSVFLIVVIGCVAQYFISPFQTNNRLKPTKLRTKTLIPLNNYIPPIWSSGHLFREEVCNASALDIFRIVGDVATYKTWAGYGIQSIAVTENERFGAALAR